MKYNISFLEPAEEELREAVNYYNGQSAGLGFEFALEVKSTLDRIACYPESWSMLSGRTRKCRCVRFPYNVIYHFSGSEIIIVAIMHAKRKPGY